MTSDILAAAGLPDPLDPELTTCHVAGSNHEVARHVAGCSDARAIAQFLYSADVVSELNRLAYEGGDGVEVHGSGWNDEGEFGWSIQTVHLRYSGDPDTYVVVEWTDGVCLQEIQIVSSVADAHLFLAVLKHCCQTNETLPERWRAATPPHEPGGLLTLQVWMTVEVDPTGRITAIADEAHSIDVDFSTHLTVDDVSYEIQSGKYLDDHAPAEAHELWDRICHTRQPDLPIKEDR